MDPKQNTEYKKISEFMSKTGANPSDALACLKTWGWDMKRALTDYNDTYNLELTDEDENKSKFSSEKKLGPALIKQNSFDVDCKKLFRGISRATDNVSIVSRARSEIATDLYKTLLTDDIENAASLHPVDTPDSTFMLPNIYEYPDDFRVFIAKDLIEKSTMNALEQAQRLNWWIYTNTGRKLWPLVTTGDGNCLLHAASLGIWGFHDRNLTLRTALFGVLSDSKFSDALHRRWRFQQTRFNKRAGFVYSEMEWIKEWDDIKSMASPEPRRSAPQNDTSAALLSSTECDKYERKPFLEKNFLSKSTTIQSSTLSSTIYESLEEIHILALAHVLRRTIIVISDTVLRDLHGEAMAPITFGGIYLPLEIEPKECNRGPLLLAYDMAHFSALVPMENGNDFPPALVPLTDNENVLLPIQFCIDPGENFDWKTYNGNEENWALTEREQIALLKEYLDIVYATTNQNRDEEIYCQDLDDVFEKKFSESEIVIPTTMDFMTNNTEETNNNKSKASRQLHSVAKQFGSISKNMSRKLKKNIGSITKLGSNKELQKKNSFNAGSGNSSSQSYTCSRILCARLRLRRHEYQEDMIRNYIECAQKRFTDIERSKFDKMSVNETEKDDSSRKPETWYNMKNGSDLLTNHNVCINVGCNQFASSETSYLCSNCYEKQKKHENLQFFNSSPRYGTGNSKFYTQADVHNHDNISKLPSLRKLNELDQTLYLSNSTFYNDVLASYNEVNL